MYKWLSNLLYTRGANKRLSVPERFVTDQRLFLRQLEVSIFDGVVHAQGLVHVHHDLLAQVHFQSQVCNVTAFCTLKNLR